MFAKEAGAASCDNSTRNEGNVLQLESYGTQAEKGAPRGLKMERNREKGKTT